MRLTTTSARTGFIVLGLLASYATVVESCTKDMGTFACSVCAYVDSVAGDDSQGDGSIDKPFKTIQVAQAASGFDGAILSGKFSLNGNFRFTPEWTFTGYGIDTVIELQGGGGLVVQNNDFHRMVLDFNDKADSVSFRGGNVGLYNCVLRDHHTPERNREIIYSNFLTMRNCLLYDVEYNIVNYRSRSSYDFTNVVSANCGSKFALQADAPTVSVDPETYKIVSHGKYTDSNGYGVYGGKCIYAWPDPEIPIVSTTTPTPTTNPVFANISAEVDSLLSNQIEMMGAIRSLGDRLSAIEELRKNESIEIRVVSLENDIRQMSQDLASEVNLTAASRDTTQTRISQLAGNLSAVQNDVSMVNKTIADIRNGIVNALASSPTYTDLTLPPKQPCTTTECVPSIQASNNKILIDGVDGSVTFSSECGTINPCDLHNAIQSIAQAIDFLKRI